MKKTHKQEVTRIVEYMISGGAWFWSGYVIIVLLSEVAPLFVANLVGNAVGITINYVLNRYWVFNKKNRKQQSAGPRYVVYTVLNAFILNYLILLWLKKIGIVVAIGQFIAAGFFTVWNYLWYKYYVFSGDKNARNT